MTNQLSRVFPALADPTRRDLVARLTDADATVGELAAPYDVSVQAISKHLKVLEQAGLVSRHASAHGSPVHLEAEVFDLMTKWIERYRQEAEGGTSGWTPCWRRWTTDEKRPPTAKEQHHDDHHEAPDRDHRPERCRSSRSTGSSTAPVDQLFRRTTDPDLFAQWVGPHSTTTTRGAAGTPAPAGASASVTPRRRASTASTARFHEVRPNDRIVQTFT